MTTKVSLEKINRRTDKVDNNPLQPFPPATALPRIMVSGKQLETGHIMVYSLCLYWNTMSNSLPFWHILFRIGDNIFQSAYEQHLNSRRALSTDVSTEEVEDSDSILNYQDTLPPDRTARICTHIRGIAVIKQRESYLITKSRWNHSSIPHNMRILPNLWCTYATIYNVAVYHFQTSNQYGHFSLGI